VSTEQLFQESKHIDLLDISSNKKAHLSMSF